MARGPTDRDACEGGSGGGCRAQAQVHLRGEPSGYSAREAGERALWGWDC